MHDQADELRQLVLRGMRRSIPRATAPPKLVAVCGGKGGVGTTALAVNLAIALAREGRSTVLVDVDLSGGDVALACRLEEGYSVADVLSGARTVHEALQLGPAGVQVLPGAWGGANMVECSPSAQERLIREVKELGAYSEVVILDVGCQLNRVTRRFWQAADMLLLVSTTDEVAVMDSYAAVKVMLGAVQGAQVHAVANRAESAAAAADAVQRLSRACQRFLGLRVTDAGYVPFDRQMAEACAARRPLMLDSVETAATAHIESLAAQPQPSVGIEE
jgi:flagellar biosynthesis protein FlhG